MDDRHMHIFSTQTRVWHLGFDTYNLTYYNYGVTDIINRHEKQIFLAQTCSFSKHFLR